MGEELESLLDGVGIGSFETLESTLKPRFHFESALKRKLRSSRVTSS